METLTLAQALRHMADRAEQGSDTPWKDLQFLSYSAWVPLNGSVMLKDLVTMKIGLKPKPKIVNGVECWPHRGELEPLKNYYVPTALSETGYCMIAGSGSACEKAHARNSVYTTEEAALVEAKAQGWV